MTLFTPFVECPSMSKCSKIICSSGGNNYSNDGATTCSKWRNDYGVLMWAKCKIIWFGRGVVPEKENEALWELIKAHYLFPSETCRTWQKGHYSYHREGPLYV
jgi:hypothetical protein